MVEPVGGWPVIGHREVVRRLQRALAEGCLAHSYLIVGPRHVGKGALALALAQALQCSAEEPPCGSCSPCRRVRRGHHPDVRVIGVVRGREAGEGPQHKEIGIDQIRELRGEANLKAYEGRAKVFIIEEAEALSPEASNCLLKTLEEPPPQVYLLLLATEERAILPTVRSRCQRLELAPLPRAEVEAALVERGVAPATARYLGRACGGLVGWALAAAENPGLLERRRRDLGLLERALRSGLVERFRIAGQLAQDFSRDRDSLREVFWSWRFWWRDVLLLKAGCETWASDGDGGRELRSGAQKYSWDQICGALRLLEESWQRLSQNANPRLTLEVLMLHLPQEASAQTMPPR